MSLNDFCAEHVSQQVQNSENSPTSIEFSNNLTYSSPDCNTTPYRRRRQTNQALEALGQLVKDLSSEELEEKLNKNDILSLTIARLLRRKYIPFNLVNPNIHLQSYVDGFKPREDFNGFLLLLNTSGRILFISDNAEYHLRKNVRSLYSQLTTIFQCIHEENHDIMRRILSSRSSDEQKMICTWNLPRGKRPSRTHTESKSMLLIGHYFHLHTDKDQYQQEPIFLARCEQILSSTPNIPTNSLGSSSNVILKFILNENFHINEVTPNIQTVLNYRSEDLIDASIGSLITSDCWNEILQAKQNSIHVQHCTTMSVMDFYTLNGERLTFLCNLYALPEGKRKPIKFGLIAQLIEPSIRDQCNIYVKKQNDERLKSTINVESVIPPKVVMNDCPISSKRDSFPPGNQFSTQNLLTKQCPIIMVPQRRKRRTTQALSTNFSNPKKIKLQPMIDSYDDQHQSNMVFNSNSSSPLSDNSFLSSSPIQEISFPCDLFSQTDISFVDEKLKFAENFGMSDDYDDLFGINSNHYQSLFLTTPTLPSCSFFA